MITEVCYNGRSNAIDLLLQDDSSGTLAASDLSAVSRFLLIVGSTTLDSAVNPAYFDASAGGGVLSLKLGGAGLATGRYTATLVLYDATNTDGIEWSPFDIIVR